jgi:hypothetical protein
LGFDHVLGLLALVGLQWEWYRSVVSRSANVRGSEDADFNSLCSVASLYISFAGTTRQGKPTFQLLVYLV